MCMFVLKDIILAYESKIHLLVELLLRLGQYNNKTAYCGISLMQNCILWTPLPLTDFIGKISKSSTAF